MAEESVQQLPVRSDEELVPTNYQHLQHAIWKTADVAEIYIHRSLALLSIKDDATTLILFQSRGRSRVHSDAEFLREIWNPKFVASKDGLVMRLKFVNKGEGDLIFGMAISDIMLNNEIKSSDIYSAYVNLTLGIKDKPTKGKKGAGKAKKDSKKPITPADDVPTADELADLEKAKDESLETYIIEQAAKDRIPPAKGVVIHDVPPPTPKIPNVQVKGKSIITTDAAADALLEL
ncbi:hypothetical protein Tco_0661915 [Tanacetum coccineum]